MSLKELSRRFPLEARKIDIKWSHDHVRLLLGKATSPNYKLYKVQKFGKLSPTDVVSVAI